MPSPEGSSVRFRRVSATLRRAAIERFARRLQKEVAHGAAFDNLITGDAELRRLNCDFRGKDYPTDVLSFPGQASRPAPLGDIAISVARARAQAREYGQTMGATQNDQNSALHRIEDFADPRSHECLALAIGKPACSFEQTHVPAKMMTALQIGADVEGWIDLE